MKRLSGKIALITGAGRGIGRATAILFAHEGADLVLLARTRTELEDTTSFCRVAGIKTVVHQVDLGESEEIARVFTEIGTEFKRIDILINNAGIFDRGSMKEYNIERFRKLLAVNLLAPFYLAQKVLPLMPLSGGTIVNISSLSGSVGAEKFPGFGAYNVSKYGLWGLTEILALENRERGIRVNQLTLSGVDTKMFSEAAPPGVKAERTPEEVARQILYLASDESAPLTGANIIMT